MPIQSANPQAVAEPGVDPYSRCVCALTKPGRITASVVVLTASPSSSRRPTAAIVPSVVDRDGAVSIGGPSTGTTQSAERTFTLAGLGELLVPVRSQRRSMSTESQIDIS